jgi:hypothetical protein
MKTIWKWTLAVTDQQSVELPRGAEILAVQIQGGLPQLWALCDSDQPKERRVIAIIGTGHPIVREPGRYINTFQMYDGALVFHAFDLPT